MTVRTIGSARTKIVDEAKTKHCAHSNCDAQYPDHRWGKIKASDEGWFFQKDGLAWCPDHTPDWVPAWRLQKGEK